jgi:hypothetical protein
VPSCGVVQAPDTVVPADDPQLAGLARNRDSLRPIPGRDALALYEANWRCVAADALTPVERALIEALADRFGAGHLLATQ